MKSRTWTCQLRLDLFPPCITKSKLRSSFISKGSNIFQHWVETFRLPSFWEVSFTQTATKEVLVGPRPTLHVLVIPLKVWKSTADVNETLAVWTDDKVHRCQYKWTFNNQFLIIDLIKDGDKLYTLGSTYYVKRSGHNEIVGMDLPTFIPERIFTLLEKWHQVRMFWKALIAGHIERCFEICNPQMHNKVQNIYKSSTECMMHKIVLHIWQSIMQNYTIFLTGQKGISLNNVDLRKYRSTILIDEVFIRRFLHIPMQVLNPINGSYRFVVCGLKGSEGIAFNEITSVYDRFVWGFFMLTTICAVCAWQLLPFTKFNSSNSSGPDQLKVFLRPIFSLAICFLEQGDIGFRGRSICSHKVRMFLGIYLLMCIVISNGYKNSNVYNMIAPRKSLRYETFSDLMADNFSVFTLGKPNYPYLYEKEWNMTNWYKKTVSVKRESPLKISYYVYNSIENHITSVYTSVGRTDQNEHKNIPTPYLSSKKDLELNYMVRSKTYVYLVNIFTLWVDQLKKISLNPDAISAKFGNGVGFFRYFFQSEFPKVEKEFLLSLLRTCNKTALVLNSIEAEVYARHLTTKRGNTGKEVYYRHYFLIKLGGWVNSALLGRLSRIKESGVIEWLVNVTEYISITQFQERSSQKEFISDGHPAGASLEGNIIVIFSLLVGGFITAVFGFILEITCYFYFAMDTRIIAVQRYMVKLISKLICQNKSTDGKVSTVKYPYLTCRICKRI